MSSRALVRFVMTTAVAVTLLVRPALAQGATNAAVDREVSVTTLGNAKFVGKLVDLTPTEVVLQQRGFARDTRLQLANVSRVELVNHHKRNLAIIGALTGALITFTSDICGNGQQYVHPTGEPNCITAKPALYIEGLAGLGALIGHKLDRSPKNVLYPSASRQASVRIAPLAMRKGASVGVTVRW